jgi:hypothetical protein
MYLPLHSIFFCESASTPVTARTRKVVITFFDAHDNIIPNTAAPLHIIYYTATTAVMHITNQKNGARGSRISHTTTGMKACPVQALSRRPGCP